MYNKNRRKKEIYILRLVIIYAIARCSVMDILSCMSPVGRDVPVRGCPPARGGEMYPCMGRCPPYGEMYPCLGGVYPCMGRCTTAWGDVPPAWGMFPCMGRCTHARGCPPAWGYVPLNREMMFPCMGIGSHEDRFPCHSAWGENPFHGDISPCIGRWPLHREMSSAWGDVLCMGRCPLHGEISSAWGDGPCIGRWPLHREMSSAW